MCIRDRLVNEQMWAKTDADVPSFKAGDTITVSYKIVEGSKERVQSFRGVVIQIKGSGKTKMFTIRKISGGVGVERIFPPVSYTHLRCFRARSALRTSARSSTIRPM